MNIGVLIVDRGSKDIEVKEELNKICYKIKQQKKYVFSKYCFLEVSEPSINKMMTECFKFNIDKLIVIPYFLYSGKKVKLAVNRVMKFHNQSDIKLVVTKPMLMHELITKSVENRINDAILKNKIKTQEQNMDVLIICHGSKDPNSHLSIMYVVNKLKPKYRNVKYCFFEIESPNINDGIRKCIATKPDILIIVFYFLHNGAHMKYDIYEELIPALNRHKFTKFVFTEYIGKDEKLMDLIITRCKEVENAN